MRWQFGSARANGRLKLKAKHEDGGLSRRLAGQSRSSSVALPLALARIAKPSAIMSTP